MCGSATAWRTWRETESTVFNLFFQLIRLTLWACDSGCADGADGDDGKSKAKKLYSISNILWWAMYTFRCAVIYVKIWKLRTCHIMKCVEVREQHRVSFLYRYCMLKAKQSKENNTEYASLYGNMHGLKVKPNHLHEHFFFLLLLFSAAAVGAIHIRTL